DAQAPGQGRTTQTRGPARQGTYSAADSAGASAASPEATGVRLILPRWSISVISTWILSPTLTTSSTLLTRLPLPSLLMWTRPSLPGMRLTKAPKAAVLTTVPRNRSPTFGMVGLAIWLMTAMAASAAVPDVAPM